LLNIQQALFPGPGEGSDRKSTLHRNNVVIATERTASLADVKS